MLKNTSLKHIKSLFIIAQVVIAIIYTLAFDEPPDITLLPPLNAARLTGREVLAHE